MTNTTFNIYQAALTLRTNYSHLDGLLTEPTEDAYTNLYFMFHDALHTLLGQPPYEEYEPIVLSAEMLLGGVDITLDIDLDILTTLIGTLPTETLEILMDFYTNWFNR